MPITITPTATLTPARTYWVATETTSGKNIASGYCALDKFPQEAETCVQLALELPPYEEIKKTFLPIGWEEEALLEMGCVR